MFSLLLIRTSPHTPISMLTRLQGSVVGAHCDGTTALLLWCQGVEPQLHEFHAMVAP